MALRDLFVLSIVFGVLPFVFRRPHYGVLLWSWLAFMNPHRLTWGIAYSFPVAMVTGVVTILSVIFTKEPKKLPVTPVTVVLMIFVFWMCFTTIFALTADASIGLERALKIQAIIFIILMIMRDKERINQLVWVIVLSLGYFGVKGGVFVVLTGGSYKVCGPPGSFIAGNNELALALLMTMPLIYYLQTVTKNLWIKLGLIGSMPLMLFSVLASYSRGAFVGMVVMLLVLWIKNKKKLRNALLFMLVVIGAVSFMPQQWTERIETTREYQQDASAMGRINSWWFAYNLAVDRPLVGGGFDTFTPDLFLIYAPNPYDFHDSHSIYFEILGEQGFFGLFLFLLLGLLALRTGTWIIRSSRGHEELQWASHLASMIQVSLAAYATAGAFLGLAYYDLPYNLIAILVVVKIIVEKHLAEQRRLNPQRRAYAYAPDGGSR